MTQRRRLGQYEEMEYMSTEIRQSKLPENSKQARPTKEPGYYEHRFDDRYVDLKAEFIKLRKDYQIIFYEIVRIRKRIESNRRNTIIKYAIFLISVFVVVSNITNVYESSHSLRISLKETPSFERIGPMAYRLTINPTFYNPSQTTLIFKRFLVKIYVDGYLLSENIPASYLVVPPGQHNRTFQFILNLGDLSHIMKGEMVGIRVEGEAVVSLKVFGIIPWYDDVVYLDLLPQQFFFLSEQDKQFLRLDD